MRNATTAAKCRLQDTAFIPDTSFEEGAWATETHFTRRIWPMAMTVLRRALLH